LPEAHVIVCELPIPLNQFQLLATNERKIYTKMEQDESSTNLFAQSIPFPLVWM